MKQLIYCAALLACAAFATAFVSLSKIGPNAEPQGAVTNYFLKIEGINGGIQTGKHRGWLTLDSVSIHDNSFRFERRADISSPEIKTFGESGKKVGQVMVAAKPKKGTKQIYLVVKLQDCIVSSYQLSQKQEGFSIRYADITGELTENGKVAKISGKEALDVWAKFF